MLPKHLESNQDEKVRRFTIPVDNEHLLLVNTEVDTDLNVIYDILKLIHG
ncbi:MAG: hypothetical protein WA461_09460 [Nitrososphaeraceae archaeon]